MCPEIISKLNNQVKIFISSENLNKLQKLLLQIDLYIKAEDLISYIVIVTIVLFIISLVVTEILDLPIIIVLILTVIPLVVVSNYILFRYQNRCKAIEDELPELLHQISSLLRVGLGLESALREISNNNESILNNEIKRALMEVKFQKPLNEALLDMSKRNDSDNLKHTLEIIINTNESGGNMADILDVIADDLADELTLRKERRASVMMSVMFLIISTVIATPFAFGMVNLYSKFIETVGRTTELVSVIPTAAIGYIIIHSILVSLLMGIVMSSDMKDGIKYIFLLTPASIGVYYLSQMIFSSILAI